MGVLRVFLACLACSLLAIDLARSDVGPPPPSNVLYGFISTNTTLTYASPGPVYDLRGDLVVLPGVTLSVEPGVTIRVAANRDTLQGYDASKTELVIQGTLTANAMNGDTIRFVSWPPGIGTWGGLWLQAAGSHLTLRRCVVSGAFNGVQATVGEGIIQECFISGSSDGSGRSGGSGLYMSSGLTTAAPDSNSATATHITSFNLGVRITGSAIARNIVARNNNIGFADGAANYCTAVYNAQGFGNTEALNSIAVGNVGAGFVGGVGDYLDSWNNPAGNCSGAFGPHIASFDPFFVNPQLNDFRLSGGSVFKHYSNSGGEIGAYGPTAAPTTVGVVVATTRTGLAAMPNPTRGRTILSFNQPTAAKVVVDVLDLTGRRVRQLSTEIRAEGLHRVTWDGTDDQGRPAAQGVYFWRVVDAGSQRVGRIVVVH